MSDIERDLVAIRRRSRGRLFVVAALLALAVLGATSCADQTHTQAAEPPAAAELQAVTVTVAPVALRPTQRQLKFVGTLFGNEEVTLSSQVEGQVRTIGADLGDTVSAGQVLLEIDDADLRARLREIEARLAKARADEARARRLLDANVVSPQEYESMQTAVAVSEAQRDTLSVLLDHARVRSPLAGAVVRRLVSTGEYVRPGTPLFELVADHPLKLRGDVPERFAGEIEVGQPVDIQVDAFRERVFRGRLARVSPAANPENRSLTVEALVDNPERELKAGFFANASIVTRADDEAMVVPETALITFAGVTKVFVVQNDHAYERKVRPGTRGGDGTVEILAGLETHELVATSGLARLETGARVSIR